jgi:type IV secretion system protein VirB2
MVEPTESRRLIRLVPWWIGLVSLGPAAVMAQGSPFDTGANSLVTFALTIATPIAVLIVIALAIAAAVGRVSWAWVIGAIIGIAAIFGAPQIVAWIRSLFGV